MTASGFDTWNVLQIVCKIVMFLYATDCILSVWMAPNVTGDFEALHGRGNGTMERKEKLNDFILHFDGANKNFSEWHFRSLR